MHVILLSKNVKNIRVKGFFDKFDLNKINNMQEDSRINWIYGRLAAKIAYSKFKKKDLQEISISSHRSGAPYIKNSNIFCSISHSNKFFLAAVSKYPVGVDIERSRKRSKELLKYIASDREIEIMKAKESENLTPLVWTIKGSVLKGTGKGLALPISKIRIISKYKNSYIVLIQDKATKYPSEWRVFIFKKKAYYLSIATPKESNEKPAFHRHKLTELYSRK